MSTLLGKVEAAWQCTGTLRVNGRKARLSSLQKVIGFVPQDDILHTELSAAKNIYYSGEIRLPPSWTRQQRASFRGAVIECLGLADVKDTPIGTELDRGLNNGQRKLTSIGVELVAAPLAMFLDEPTSGLDSTTSLEICSILREIADRTHADSRHGDPPAARRDMESAGRHYDDWEGRRHNLPGVAVRCPSLLRDALWRALSPRKQPRSM